MTPATQDNPLYWLSRLSNAELQYKCDPSKTNRAHLVAEIYQIKQLVENGLAIPKTLPEATQREAITYSQWMRRQVDEALLMFRCSPTTERISGVLNTLNYFEDGVAKGRVNP
jgi:hypothetical protein